MVHWYFVVAEIFWCFFTVDKRDALKLLGQSLSCGCWFCFELVYAVCCWCVLEIIQSNRMEYNEMGYNIHIYLIVLQSKQMAHHLLLSWVKPRQWMSIAVLLALCCTWYWIKNKLFIMFPLNMPIFLPFYENHHYCVWNYLINEMKYFIINAITTNTLAYTRKGSV